MASTSSPDRWYFSKDQIRNSPSVQDGIEHAKELGYRQQCANLIQDIGQRLQVTQLVINTAIVYMHRFYMLHSFTVFKRNTMGPCFLFLAAKVEEYPRRLEHVLKATHMCLNKNEPPFDPKSDDYMRLQQELVDNESVLLQTLGFEVAVDHPNTYVVKCAQLVKASKELAQTAYFLATNSLHLTSFCIQYKPTVVACVCIYVACLWAHYIIPETESKNWYEFIDNSVTKSSLEDLSAYFIKILDSCPTRLKKRLTCGGAMVYKEGKVLPKKESSSGSSKDGSTNKDSTTEESGSKPSTEENDETKIKIKTEKTNDNTTNKQSSSTSSTSSTSSNSHSHNSKQGPNVKNHLTGLLKPQPHESTPPPSRSSSSTSQHHHQKKHHEHRSSSSSSSSSDPHKIKHTTSASLNPEQRQKVASPHVVGETRANEAGQKTTTPKTHEQLKIEQRKKWTPQQVEEYRKRKEKEKLIHQQRKRDAERNEIDPATGKPSTKSEHHKNMTGHVKKPIPNTNSPMKRQKIESDHHKRPHPEFTQTDGRQTNDEKTNNEGANFHPRNPISSSGSDSDSSHKSKTHHSSNYKHNYEQKPTSGESGVKPLPPPPPPPRLAPGTGSIPLLHPSSKASVKNYSNNQKYSTPPPPHPKYV